MFVAQHECADRRREAEGFWSAKQTLAQCAARLGSEASALLAISFFGRTIKSL